jgi:hypothetical protein
VICSGGSANIGALPLRPIKAAHLPSPSQSINPNQLLKLYITPYSLPISRLLIINEIASFRSSIHGNGPYFFGV